MSDDYKITPQCRNGRCKVCVYAGMNADGFCDCQCHDEDDAAPRPNVETFDSRTGGPVGVDEFPCREASCDHPPFFTKQGEQVHWSRMHSGKDPRHPAPSAEPPEGRSIVRSNWTALEPEPGSTRWLLVLRIVGFLTEVEHGAAMDNALIEWAEWKIKSDPDIERMVEILERRT